MRTALPSFKGSHKKEDKIGLIVVIRQGYLMAVAGRQVKVGCEVSNSQLTGMVRIHAVPPLGCHVWDKQYDCPLHYQIGTGWIKKSMAIQKLFAWR
jgi:hypothetical protein